MPRGQGVATTEEMEDANGSSELRDKEGARCCVGGFKEVDVDIECPENRSSSSQDGGAIPSS